MALINLKTNLKDLNYGHDRQGDGNSGQPYIQKHLDLKLPSALDFLGNDFLLRGGPLGAPISATNDLLRLSKYFTDNKSPSGLLFALKQNLLSRTAVKTQAGGKLINEGVYTPISTLSQAGVNAFGLHFNKQGLNPIPGSFGSLKTYTDVVSGPNLTPSNLSLGTAIASLTSINNNRLVDLYNVKVNKSTSIITNNGIIISQADSVNLLRYSGGPGSVLGVGLTNIKFADQRTGLNNPYYKNKNTRNAFLRGGVPNAQTKPLEKFITTTRTSPFAKTTLSGKYANLIYDLNLDDYNKISSDGRYDSLSDTNLLDSSNKDFYKSSFNPSVYLSGSIFEPNTDKTEKNNTHTWNNTDFLNAESYRFTKELTDFRAKLRKPFDTNSTRLKDLKAFRVLGNSPDYTENRIENRVGLGDPGESFDKNLSSYTSGSDGSGVASPDSYDKITVLPLYKSSGPDTKQPINDLVKFRIAAIDNDDPSQKVYIHFRAFLGSITDSYNGDWNSSKYVGRGENFYTQGGSDRKISLSFTVAAQSKVELIPMYQKLNYLASLISPDYSDSGYMRGSLITLTIGGYFYEQPGFISSLTYEMDEASPWEIGINDEGKSDSSVKELSHIIKVSSFGFTPIHNFVPRKAKHDDLKETPFIALTADGGKSNY